MISIVIPFFNEGKVLKEHALYLQGLKNESELIFVDGGSTDNSASIAEKFGKVIRTPKGRALQMNIGARYATHDIILFMHADNYILPETLDSISRALNTEGVPGGCLTQRIENNKKIFRRIEAYGNTRAKKRKIFFGDQGIFVRKDIFFELGGYPAVEVMEDILFTKKLRKVGKSIILADPIFVSSRRWKEKGLLKTLFYYNFLMALYLIRVPLKKISRFSGDVR